MGEEFGASVCPPVPCEEASIHEFCEAIWLALGEVVTPMLLASLSDKQIQQLTAAFGTWFECSSPSPVQVTEAVASTLSRWPPDSFG